MYVEIVFPGESFIAEIALKTFLISMRANMFGQIVLLIEGVRTFMALEWFFFCVCSNVGSQCKLLDKCFVTERT